MTLTRALRQLLLAAAAFVAAVATSAAPPAAAAAKEFVFFIPRMHPNVMDSYHRSHSCSLGLVQDNNQYFVSIMLRRSTSAGNEVVPYPLRVPTTRKGQSMSMGKPSTITSHICVLPRKPNILLLFVNQYRRRMQSNCAYINHQVKRIIPINTVPGTRQNLTNEPTQV